MLGFVLARGLMPSDDNSTSVTAGLSKGTSSEPTAKVVSSSETEPNLKVVPHAGTEIERLKREVARLKSAAAIQDTSGSDHSPESGHTQQPKRIAKAKDEPATERRRIAALPDAREQNLFAALNAAQVMEDSARREVQSIRSRPHRSVNISALKTGENQLRMAEGWTRKARRAYEDYVQSRHMKTKALDLADALPSLGSASVKDAPQWTQARVMALSNSIWALQRGYLNPMAIVRATGGTTARLYTEDEEDAMKLFSACQTLALEALELSALRHARPRPRALKQTADACLALYNRCADYCGVDRRCIDSPAATHAAAIKKQADARVREDAVRDARARDTANRRRNGQELKPAVAKKTTIDEEISESKKRAAKKKAADQQKRADKKTVDAKKSPAVWSRDKIDALIQKVLDVKKLNRRVSNNTLKNFNRLHGKLQESLRYAGDATSGRMFDRMCRHANMLMHAYNRAVSSEHRVTVENLGVR